MVCFIQKLNLFLMLAIASTQLFAMEIKSIYDDQHFSYEAQQEYLNQVQHLKEAAEQQFKDLCSMRLSEIKKIFKESPHKHDESFKMACRLVYAYKQINSKHKGDFRNLDRLNCCDFLLEMKFWINRKDYAQPAERSTLFQPKYFKHVLYFLEMLYGGPIKSLDLQDQNISQLPMEIALLQNLEELDLMYNNLKTLPAEVGCISTLSKIFLYKNPIESLPGVIQNIPTVEYGER